jgi:hypothetical protein
MKDQPEIKYRKVYIRVNIDIMPDGSIRPRYFYWKDGKRYSIDRVKYVTKAASIKVGGCGTRYTVMVEGKERYFFEEDGKWFVEEQVIVQ